MKHCYLFLFLLFFMSCNARQKQDVRKQEKAREFPMVSVPSMITEPEERAEYLALHYWDLFNFKDTTYIHIPEVTEQALSNFIDVMGYVTPETADKAMKRMVSLSAVDSTMFNYFSKLNSKYLYDPNSPLRNETLYISVLQAELEAPVWDETYKIRPSLILQLALKNRPGDSATDFVYTLASGKTMHLSEVQSDYLLLFFYNPDCSNCKEITALLAASPVIKELETQKKIQILAVYPDEEVEAWRKHISQMPAHWINAYDADLSIQNDELYDLRAMPTLYLLDKDKKVILKDARENEVEAYLKSVLN